MTCPNCGSELYDLNYAGSYNGGDGVTCYEDFLYLTCHHKWQTEIDCPDYDDSAAGEGYEDSDDLAQANEYFDDGSEFDRFLIDNGLIHDPDGDVIDIGED